MNFRDLLPDRGLESVTNLFGVVERRLWSSPGKAHIELPDLRGDEYRDFARALTDEIDDIAGVHWAVPNGAISRVIVAWDEERTELDAILEAVDDVEERFGFVDGHYCQVRPDHPGDDEPLVRGIARMGADVLGAASGVAMKVLRRTPGRRRFDLAAVMSVVDNVPHIRQILTDRMGKASADISIGLSNPLIQGIGSGPVSPTLDFGLQLAQFIEIVERRRSWIKREPELCDRPERARAPRDDEKARPIPIPDGAIEKYAENVWNMSVGGFFVGLADTQELESAVTPILDALPKPARYGRHAFSAALARCFGERGMVIMDPQALRRLDRVDCIIVDKDLLVTNQWALDRIVTGDDVDAVTVFENAEALLDPTHPDLRQQQGRWVLAPAQHFDVDKDWTDELRDRGGRGDFLALAKDGDVRALFSIRVVIDPASRALVNSIHEADLELIIADDSLNSDLGFSPDRIVEKEGLDRFIRHIQRDYQVVAFFGDGPQPAMNAADFALGFYEPGGLIPWQADVIAGDNLDDANLVVEAIVESREVSRNCANLAGAGAGIGALSAVRGLEKTRPGRVMSWVNAASLIALVYGTYRAHHLGEEIQDSPTPPEPWHRLRVDDVLERLQTSTEGLSGDQVQKNLPRDEKIPSRPRRILRSIAHELANPLTPVLAGGAAVSAVVGSLTDAGIVGTVIAFNGLVGGLERFKAEESIQKMAQRETLQVTVRRRDRWREISAEELIVGDILRLESGDVVPADCRIVDATRLEVDESSLTGESLPVSKNSDPNFAQLPSERRSMLYSGTAVVAGSVTAAVVATGKNTEIYRSRWMTQHRSRSTEGVEARLKSFSDMTLPYAGASGGFLMTLGVFRRRELNELVGPAVNLAVAAVPEGLPLLATAAQLAASRRLSDRNVIVHNPRAMEALGRVDTLCIDKTGTLTEGTLKFDGVCRGDHQVSIDDEGWDEIDDAIFRAALRATPVESDEGPLPHATDQAIVDGQQAVGIDVGDWESLGEVPFKTELGFHAVLGRIGNRHRVAVKGSPEEVLERCSGQRLDGEWANLSNKRRDELLERAEALAGQGLRILAVATRRYRGDTDKDLEAEDISGLTFRGFLTLSDPLRPAAAGAVKSIRDSGVSLLMLTGDHPETARRIAHEVGISTIHQVLTGDQIEEMDDDKLAEVLPDTTVIARMTPAHKVRIVEALQRAGRLVAMTGDGGNDAAAIRLADAGIALGADSAGAARDAADLVVTDARIETIIDAVVEGRGMWRSVRDAVSILIGGNLGEIGFMLASGMVQTIPALNARQLLLVNLFTDVAPAMAVALRPPPDISPDQLLHEGPEESLGEALMRDINWRAAITASSAFGAWLFARYTFQKKRASTVGLVTVVCAQLGQTLTAAKPTVPVWAASLGSAAALLAIIETPGISQLLGCRPLGPVGLATAFSSAALATGASAVIPRLPTWRQAIADRLPTGAEPTMQDFLDDYYEHFPDGASMGMSTAAQRTFRHSSTGRSRGATRA